MEDIFLFIKVLSNIEPSKALLYIVPTRQIQLTEVTSWHKLFAFAKKKKKNVKDELKIIVL